MRDVLEPDAQIPLTAQVVLALLETIIALERAVGVRFLPGFKNETSNVG